MSLRIEFQQVLKHYLYMSEQHERILELMTWIFEQVETGSTNK